MNNKLLAKKLKQHFQVLPGKYPTPMKSSLRTPSVGSVLSDNQP